MRTNDHKKFVFMKIPNSCIENRAGHYTVARRIRRINPSHSSPSVIVAIVRHGHGFQTV